MASTPEVLRRLSQLTDLMPARLYAVDGAAMRHVPAPGKWSKVQILGHLCDSAANNHQRIVRAQYGSPPEIAYD